jgi:hypothetical protein
MLTEQCRADWYSVVYAGTWMVTKYRKQARITGVQTTARLMRSRGVPIALTLRILGVQQ